MSLRLCFGPFELDPDKRRLLAAGEPVAISDRQLDVLVALTAKAGQIVAKDDLIRAAWADVAVGDNSLEQIVSALRRLLGAPAGGGAYIETVARRGYRFGVAVSRHAPRETDAGLDALLAPHRSFIEGRAALETLGCAHVAHARAVFEEALQAVPDHASAHIGLASACVMQFEMTRADRAPDTKALETAVVHAREACRLDPESGDAWGTLGFVLDRTGAKVDALAAATRALTLEPDNWRHYFRLAYVSWGEGRLRAAQRTLALVPGFALAHWFAATVHVARQAFDQADREIAAALAASRASTSESRFSSVAVHWLDGLLAMRRGDAERAMRSFEAELALEEAGHLYARECCANTWYAIGALKLRQRQPTEARAAFEQAITRVPAHVLAAIGLTAAGGQAETIAFGRIAGTPSPVDGAIARAAAFVLRADHSAAAGIVESALATAPPGSAGWLLPIEPLLNVVSASDAWAGALSSLRNRAV